MEVIKHKRCFECVGENMCFGEHIDVKLIHRKMEMS